MYFVNIPRLIFLSFDCLLIDFVIETQSVMPMLELFYIKPRQIVIITIIITLIITVIIITVIITVIIIIIITIIIIVVE